MSSFDVAKKYLKPAKDEAAKTAEPPAVDLVIDDKVITVLIDSAVWGAPLWFSFSSDFHPCDGIPVFYADELELLKNKAVSTLRKIYETKLAFGAGTRVNNEVA
jgi:hypothetical protein